MIGDLLGIVLRPIINWGNLSTLGHKKTSLTITGRVFDQVTTGVGAGLYVGVYKSDNNNSEPTILKTVRSEEDGSYYIHFSESEVLANGLSTVKELDLCVSQGNRLLDISGDTLVDTDNTKDSYLKDLFVKTLPVVKGTLKRSNDVDAVGCLVELFVNNQSEATYVTNIKGEYEIPYEMQKDTNTLQLKFYNNEHITAENPVLSVYPGEKQVAATRTRTVQGDEPFVGDVAEDPTSKIVYEVVTVQEIASTSWSIKEKPLELEEVVVSQESNGEKLQEKKFWKYLTGTDQALYKVLDKRIVYKPTHRDCYIRKKSGSGSFNPTASLAYDLIVEKYKKESSPQVITGNRKEVLHHQFENTTLDAYTRITNREEEFIPVSRPSEDTGESIPELNRKEGYSIEDTPTVAALVGSSDDDILMLSQARSFNNAMKLGQVELLFGLIKMEVNVDVASLFAMSSQFLAARINNAVEESIIPEQEGVEGSLAKLKDKLIRFTAKKFDSFFKDVNDDTIKKIGGINEKKMRFISTLVEYSYDNRKLEDGFWNAVAPRDNQGNLLGLEELEFERLKQGVQYSEVCHSNDAFINLFVEATTNAQDNSTVNTLKPFSDLLQMTKDELVDLISGNAQVLEFEHANELYDASEAVEVKTDKYASYIQERVETLFPTEALFMRFAKPNGQHVTNDLQFPADVPVKNFNDLRMKLISPEMTSTTHFFDITRSSAKPYYIEKESARDYITRYGSGSVYEAFFEQVGLVLLPDPNKTKQDRIDAGKEEWIKFLNLLQRVYSITRADKFETVKALLQGGYYSAYDVVKGGKDQFLGDATLQLFPQKRRFVFNAAEYKVNKALALLNKYSPSSNSALPEVIKGKQLDASRSEIELLNLPDLEVLFGDQDVTDTKHGESVLGPAAYLVDILNELKKLETTNQENYKNLYEALVARRPDIVEIPLNCTNAVTPVPYIDLVIEILENAIFSAELKLVNGPGSAHGWDTTKDEEQLKTDPEYCEYKVYEHIKNTPVSSWMRRPFDYVSEQIKLYTKALGIVRYKLAKPFSKNTGVVNPYYDVLGLPSKVTDLFPDEQPPSLPKSNPEDVMKDYFQNFLPFVNEVVMPGDVIAGTSYNLPRILLRDFLQQTGMRLSVFKELTSSYYVNPFVAGERYSIHFDNKQELSTAYLEFGSKTQRNSFAKRLYQFQLVHQYTGWSVPVLDALLLSDARNAAHIKDATESNAFIDKKSISFLGRVKLVQEDLALSEDQVTGLFGSLEVLKYEEETTFVSDYFVDNDLPSELNKTFKLLTTSNTPAEGVVNPPVFVKQNELSPFVQYMGDAMDLEKNDMMDLLGIAGLSDANATLSPQSLRNIVFAWQLSDALDISTSQMYAVCKLMELTVSEGILVDNLEKIIEFHAQLLQEKIDATKLVRLLEDRTDSVTSFNVDEIINVIFSKKEQLKVTAVNSEKAIELKQFIIDLLAIDENTDKSFIEAVLDSYVLEGKTLVDYIFTQGHHETVQTAGATTITYDHTVVKQKVRATVVIAVVCFSR